MRRPVAWIALILAITLGFSLNGCSLAKPAAGETMITIGGQNLRGDTVAVLLGPTMAGVTSLTTTYATTLAAQNWKPEVTQATDADSQSRQLDAAIATKPAMIIIEPIDPDAVSARLSSAKAAGTIIVSVGKLPPAESVSLHVGWDEFGAGILQAETLLMGLQERRPNKEWNIELFAGDKNDKAALARFNGSMAILTSKLDEEVVYVRTGRRTFWQAAVPGLDARQLTKTLKTTLEATYPRYHLDGLILPADALAPAAMGVTLNAGQGVPVISSRGSEASAVLSIMNDEQYATQYRNPSHLAREVLRLTQSIKAGEPIGINKLNLFHNQIKDVNAVLISPEVVTAETAAKIYTNNSVLGPLAVKR